MVESQSQRQEPQAGMLCCGNLALLWQHCRLGGGETSPPAARLPQNAWMWPSVPGQGRVWLPLAGTAEGLTRASPSPAVGASPPSETETLRQGPPWLPQSPSAQHGAWHAVLNECHLTMASSSVNALQAPFLIAPGLGASYFSDF